MSKYYHRKKCKCCWKLYNPSWLAKHVCKPKVKVS